MPPTETTARTDERDQLRRMRLVSLLEGATLVALLFVAVPLKHIAGHPAATSIIGPIHGMAFLLYVWMLIQTVSGGLVASGDCPRRDRGVHPFRRIRERAFSEAKRACARWLQFTGKKMGYLWLKAFHVTAVIGWIGGMLVSSLFIAMHFTSSRPLQACPGNDSLCRSACPANPA